MPRELLDDSTESPRQDQVALGGLAVGGPQLLQDVLRNSLQPEAAQDVGTPATPSVSENQSEQGFPVHGLLQRGIDFGRRVRIHGSTC